MCKKSIILFDKICSSEYLKFKFENNVVVLIYILHLLGTIKY